MSYIKIKSYITFASVFKFIVMAKAEILFKVIRKWEGGWSDHKNDKGGKTNMGITLSIISFGVTVTLVPITEKSTVQFTVYPLPS